MAQRRAAEAPPQILRWEDRPLVGPAVLLRMRDPITLAAFAPDETVWLHSCEAAYHESSYRLLASQACSVCPECHRDGGWQSAVVPHAAPNDGASDTTSTEVVPAPPKPGSDDTQAPTAAPPTATAAPVISVADASAHFGNTVVLLGRVVEVQEGGGTGTAFLLFEPGHRFSVLKVVVFARVRRQLRAAGVEVTQLAGRDVAIYGVLERHPAYGPQIVLRDERHLGLGRTAE